jgi:hypothetical protein
VRPAHFLDGAPGNADVSEHPVIKFEKLPVLVSSFQPQGYAGQPREQDFPEPSKVRKRG